MTCTRQLTAFALVFVRVAVLALIVPPFLPQAVLAATIDIAQSGKLIHDPEGRLNPEQALAKARALPDDAPGGRISSVGKGYWLIADLTNDSDTPDWALNLYFSRYERAQLSVFDGNRLIHQAETGLHAVAAAPVPTLAPGYTLPFNFPEGQRRTVVLRLESVHLVTIAIDAGPRVPLEANMNIRRVITLLAFGAILALIGYNLFLGVALRDTAYLYYCLNAFGYGAYLFIVFGYLASLFGVSNHTTPLFWAGALIQFFGPLFIYRVLDLPRHAPRFAKVFLFFLILVVAITAARLSSDALALIPISRLTGLLVPVLILTAAVVAWRAGVRRASYVIIGWVPMLLATAFAVIGMTGKIAHPPFVALASLGTVVFEMVFLSLALADRVRQLRADKAIAEETNKAKSAFLATMSHEVRTPLNGILGTLDLLRRTTLTDKQRTYVHTMHTSGAALLALLNNVLDHAKAEAGKITVRTETFKPSRLLESVVDLNRSRADSKGIALTVSIDADTDQHVAGDPALLRQVLLNLIGNAVKFTDHGTVSVTMAHQDDHLRFDITDTGPGIPTTALPTLFDHFAQVENTTGSRREGTGLGLAIAREMVGAMGGDIGVESTEGAGSRFFFHVPVRDVDAAPSQAVEASLGGLRVLVVDDTDVNRIILSDDLTGQGATVVTAASGEQALSLCKDQAFDVVLMDLFMPGMDGAEATARLLERDAAVSVIGITAAIGPEQRAQCLRAGMADVLGKPVDFDLLHAVLKRLRRQHDPAEAAVLNMGVLQRTADILGPDKTRDAISSFARQSSVILDEIRAAQTESDPDALVRTSHRLAGLAGTLGLDALTAQAIDVQEHAGQGTTITQGQLDRLASLHADSLHALETARIEAV